MRTHFRTKMNHKLKWFTAVVAVSSMAVAMAPAHAGEVGVSGTEIKFGMTVPMTGTASLEIGRAHV